WQLVSPMNLSVGEQRQRRASPYQSKLFERLFRPRVKRSCHFGVSNVFRPDLGEYRLNVLKLLQVPQHSSRELIDDLERSVLHRDESGRNAKTRNIAGQP